MRIEGEAYEGTTLMVSRSVKGIFIFLFFMASLLISPYPIIFVKELNNIVEPQVALTMFPLVWDKVK